MEDPDGHDKNHPDEVIGVKVWLECVWNNGRRDSDKEYYFQSFALKRCRKK